MSRKRKTTGSRPDDEPRVQPADVTETDEVDEEEFEIPDAPEIEILSGRSVTSESEEDSDGEEIAARKISRSEFLDMMAAKNAANAELAKQNRDLEAKLKEANDKWLRSAAEFENYRKRTRKEWELLKQQSRADVILEILAVVDDFERAFSAVEESEASGFVEGFRLIYNNLILALERQGVKELEALHRPFDPNFHMAIGQVERDDLDVGAVAEVIQKGYTMNDVVIRPANVLVAK